MVKSKYIKKRVFNDVDFNSAIDEYFSTAKYKHEVRFYNGMNLETESVRNIFEKYLSVGLNPVTASGKKSTIIPNKNFLSLKPVIDRVGLKNSQNIVMGQEPGKIQLIHTDKYGSFSSKNSPDELIRLIVFLTDYVPGQFMLWGEDFLSDWKAGDILYDWGDTPHATANASTETRVILRMTGVSSPTYKNFISSL